MSEEVMSERDMLARTLQAEAGNQGFEGMMAVGSVIANRVNSGRFGDGFKGVIMKPGQFSAWNGVTGYADGEQGQDMTFTPDQDAYTAADAILGGNYEDVTGGAVNYYADNISNPDWGVSGGGEWIRIGDHLFGTANQAGSFTSDGRVINQDGTEGTLREMSSSQNGAVPEIQNQVPEVSVATPPTTEDTIGSIATSAMKDLVTQMMTPPPRRAPPPPPPPRRGFQSISLVDRNR